MADTDKTNSYDYDCPEELIATVPADSRDDSRLLVSDPKRGEIRHGAFTQLPELLAEGDLLVFNNSRVVNARLQAEKTETGGAVELLVLDVLNENLDWTDVPTENLRFKCLTKSSNPPKPGMALTLLTSDGRQKSATVLGWEDGISRVEISFERSPEAFLDDWGDVPLPPYIESKRDDKSGELAVDDAARYQTIYASEPGSVAAPTAGLHFSEPIFERLDECGVETAFVTLDVGRGTFEPIREERLSEHDMHRERYRLEDSEARKIGDALESGGRIIPVGTTSMRVLETEARRAAPLESGDKTTSLFIKPPFEFQICDGLITNFHLPESTLLALVAAFTGYDFMNQIYDAAIQQRYRLYSYGDSMIALDGITDAYDSTFGG